MAVMKIMGVSEYMKALQNMERSAEGALKKAVYEGAKVVVEAAANGVNLIPVVSGKAGFGTPEKPVQGIHRKQKQGLEESLGISKIRNEQGFVNAKIGFSGYNDFTTDKYPQGQPNVLIARAVESGTTFRKKFPFMRPAVNRSKTQAIYSMDKQIAEDLKFWGLL